ncbi:MAG: alcohol dehydrogenase catalytic domain-containing protein [Clostridiales bacterium]|nr:alcohol dehydrogenase catalytic domain-containing protein [Clostridiales bacterium]
MLAAIIQKPEVLEICEVPRPVVEDGEALIRVFYTGVCGTDVHLLHGHHATATFPLIPGHEMVGELVEVKGQEAGAFQSGQRVVAQEVLSCGRCTACAKGEDNVCQSLQIIGIHAEGSFAEYVKVPAKKMLVVPDAIDDQLAAMTEPLAVAVHDVRLSGLKVGETVLVIGGGPIGMLIAIVARAAGAKQVVISEIKKFRRDFAASMGFDVIDPTIADFDEKLTELSGCEGFDVSFEVAGVKSAISTCIDHTKCTGTVMVIAITKEPIPVDTGKIFSKELTLKGARIHNFYSFKGALELLQMKSVADDVRKLISKVYRFSDIVEAFDYAEHGEDGFKVLVRINE